MLTVPLHVSVQKVRHTASHATAARGHKKRMLSRAIFIVKCFSQKMVDHLANLFLLQRFRSCAFVSNGRTRQLIPQQLLCENNERIVRIARQLMLEVVEHFLEQERECNLDNKSMPASVLPKVFSFGDVCSAFSHER